jgi:hypothetical protein
MNNTQKLIIKAGVRNLKEFGYPSVDDTNILTDAVYAEFFRSMLKDNMGQGVDADLKAIEAMLPPK